MLNKNTDYYCNPLFAYLTSTTIATKKNREVMFVTVGNTY